MENAEQGTRRVLQELDVLQLLHGIMRSHNLPFSPQQVFAHLLATRPARTLDQWNRAPWGPAGTEPREHPRSRVGERRRRRWRGWRVAGSDPARQDGHVQAQGHYPARGAPAGSPVARSWYNYNTRMRLGSVQGLYRIGAALVPCFSRHLSCVFLI